MHGPAVEDLLKKKSSIVAHEYDTCVQGCKLYNLNDEDETCEFCERDRFDENHKPVQTMKILSIGDIVSKLLTNETTRRELSYRHNYERNTTPQILRDFFDGDLYQQFIDEGKFSNENDCAVMLFTDAFVKDKRGTRTFNMVHLVILNFDAKIRYHQKYHVQLAITPGPSTSSLDTFLLPILAELHFLETRGMIVKKNGVQICRMNIFMVLTGGDIPAINLVSRVAPHQSAYPCRYCVQRAVHPQNRRHGMYLCRTDSEMRTLDQYRHGDPSRGISGLSIFSGLNTFKGPLSFPIDELHTLCRGIGSLLYTILTVDNSKTTKYFHKMDPDLEEYEREMYPFFIEKHTMEEIGQQIESTRKYLPVAFEGSFLNIIKQTRGTRAVDYNDFMLYIVPTLIVPKIRTRAAQQAIIKLVRGCSIALQWKLSIDDLNEMDACFQVFFVYCNSKIDQRQLSVSIFKPITHYLSHISFVCRASGPLRVFSSRSTERCIGFFKGLMTGTVKTQAQASNLIEKIAIRSLLSRSIDVVDAANIIRPPSYANNSFWDNTDDENCTAQLWIPFIDNIQLCDDNERFEGVQVGALRKALRNYYRREFSESSLIMEGDIVFGLAGRAWLDKPMVISSVYYAKKNREFRRAGYCIMFDSPYLSQRFESRRRWFVGEVLFFFKHQFRGNLYFLAFVQVMKRHTTAAHDKSIPVVDKGSPNVAPKFAVISVNNDIKLQVGLVQFIGSRTKFSVIAPSHVFETDMSITAGSISDL